MKQVATLAVSVENERKLEKFDHSWVFRLCDELSLDNWALKAFGALLESSNLLDFCSDEPDPEVEDLRCGLKDIIKLCVNRQELKLDKLTDRICNTPEYIIKRSKDLCEMTREGCWTTYEVALKETRTTINEINEVVLGFGEQEYPEAKKVLDDLLNLELIIKEKISLEKRESKISKKPVITSVQNGEAGHKA